MKAEYKTKILTGLRPTNALTVANYLGAVKPILDLQGDGEKPFVFVADLHALTDNEPEVVNRRKEEIVAIYLALGLDPEKNVIYMQSDLKDLVYDLAMILARGITVSELLRVPALKDKIRPGVGPETANVLLALYPILMAADILIQRAEKVPIGEDQVSHLEVARELARKFNSKYGEVFPLPQPFAVNALKILSLKGDGKMSKSKPEWAILLTDTAKEIEKKIKSAETSFEGEMTPNLESIIKMAKGLTGDKEAHDKLDSLIIRHMKKEQVMGELKKLISEIACAFNENFQKKLMKIKSDENIVKNVLKDGGKIARERAEETMSLVYQVFK
ncbi:MAG: tryptophan--tRNA ligase [Candidatus Terrybacteria bacterium CG10_big_fil_rev_8_21_14_0_10_41_10]|uniref:Tryptophan--tRNA ligase n=1 Tax=Candidatus Terrybacteria bacterium CG10_big_fil_rev_8_21_14_0_10_41_10 TaxID=1975026 RepID=A0A2M8LAK6_9BACT|nr:MAG: tryptophan--tRNA ligase [Candidatus Terrybacteria bacterium CG10_big_fil_rev_8_21_14_0_10_41_10]